jgi:hypothetical protein
MVTGNLNAYFVIYPKIALHNLVVNSFAAAVTALPIYQP